jgi:hypothetical protein
LHEARMITDWGISPNQKSVYFKHLHHAYAGSLIKSAVNLWAQLAR